MTADDIHLKLKHIHQSFQAAFDSMPAYRHMLPFFESLFTLQEAAVPTITPEPVKITPDELEARLMGQLPLMDRSRIPYDKPAAIGLLQAICREAAKATPQLAAGAETLKALLEKDKTAIESGLDLFMSADRNGLGHLSSEMSMDDSILLFFMYHATWPSVARQADLIADSYEFEKDWSKGYCPVCGSPPSLAFLAENGGLHLVCEFCRHQWPFKRIQCPSCGNTDSAGIAYFFSEEEKTYRVYTCDACKTYIKAIDTRLLTRPFYPPLESIVTTHLDLQAQEMGYRDVASEQFGYRL